MITTHERTVTITELSYCSGVSVATVRELIEHDLIEPVEAAPDILFGSDAVKRVHTILRLHMDLEVGYPAMGLVLGLLERIERLERAD